MSYTTACIAEAVAQYVVQPGQATSRIPIAIGGTLDRVNSTLSHLTGISDFFPDQQALETFRQAISVPGEQVDQAKLRQWGDFQTPASLAVSACRYLVEQGVSPRVIIEPTCGGGSFVLAALDAFPAIDLIYGVEIQERYIWQLKLALLTRAFRGPGYTTRIELFHDDIFAHRFSDEARRAQNILIIGNPPWVTSAELGTLEAENLPMKRNIKGLNGLDAITGKGNFDIGEFILLRLLDLFSEQRGTLAMLCKNAVIKNIVEALPKRQSKVANIRALAIDAAREFNAAVDASLLVLDLGASKSSHSCRIASLERPDSVTRTFGWARDKFIANIDHYESVAELDGICPWVWRQGIKHDCASVMELQIREGTLINGEGEQLDVEDAWVYGLLKGSDLRRFEAPPPRKKVIVTQRNLDEDPTILQNEAPKLWTYLESHSAAFRQRKSSIYRNRPRFTIFGVGEYSFKPFKVAISGLHKKPCFSVVPPDAERPIMLDDTCYFLGFDAYLDALWTMSVLNSGPVLRLLDSIVFTDAKRPYTKEILMRIDLVRATTVVSFDEISDLWTSQNYRPNIAVSEADYEVYRQRFATLNQGRTNQQLSLGI